MPLLSGTEARATNEADIPAFRVGSNNQFQFLFHIDSQKTGLCTATAADVARAAIDPDSSVDFSAFAHYTGLPNLAYFANSGFPFTRLADLAGTANALARLVESVERDTYFDVQAQDAWYGAALAAGCGRARDQARRRLAGCRSSA